MLNNSLNNHFTKRIFFCTIQGLKSWCLFMNILTDVLVLEVTQLCNLTCKHCLKGKSCSVFMSDEIIYNTFKEVKIVNTLLLTGGEVFLAY